MENENKAYNLDRLAAQQAQEILRSTQDNREGSSDVDNTITKTLGVLQENGVYACALFLLSRSKAEQARARIILEKILTLLGKLPFPWGKPNSDKPDDILRYISDNVTDDLERLLLAKETLEQMLIYARYGAKAQTA